MGPRALGVECAGMGFKVRSQATPAQELRENYMSCSCTMPKPGTAFTPGRMGFGSDVSSSNREPCGKRGFEGPGLRVWPCHSNQ